MNVREFKLINEKGQQYSFMDIHNYCLLSNPEGFGYSFSASYEKLGEVFVNYIREQEQGTLSGTCNFLKYDNYTELVNFIENSKKLKFSYKVPYRNQPSIEYFKDVIFKSIGKTEKQLNGMLSCPISFEMSSLWYEENEYIYEIKSKENEVRWNFRWASRWTNYNSRKIIFNNKGHTEAPFYLEIDGQVVNPEILIEDNSNNILFHLELPITIELHEKLIYSSIDGQIQIAKQNIDGTIESLFRQRYIDFSNNSIFKLPQGLNNITLQAENNIANAVLKIYPYYRSV